jgi:hypothetical protein
MIQALENLAVTDGGPVRTEHIAIALTAGSFAYDDGATQAFEPGGATTYVEHGQRSHGEWYVAVKAVSARSGPQATVPVTISTGSWRMAASLVLDSPSSTADPSLLGVTGDTTLAT